MDGNWNIGCKVSEVFTRLEFARKEKKSVYMCVFKKPWALQVPSLDSVHLADHSVQK